MANATAKKAETSGTARRKKPVYSTDIVPTGKADVTPEAAKKTSFQTMELTAEQQMKLKIFSAKTGRKHKEILVTALMEFLARNE